MSVSDDDYYRNASCTLNYICKFLLLSLMRYLCWWTISPRGYQIEILIHNHKYGHKKILISCIAVRFLCFHTLVMFTYCLSSDVHQIHSNRYILTPTLLHTFPGNIVYCLISKNKPLFFKTSENIV